MAHNNIGPLYPYPARTVTGAIASQSITVSTVAIAVTTAFVGTSVDMVTFDIQGYDVRARWDGTDPTSTSGHILPASTAYTWACNQFNAAKFIRDSTATADATIFCSPMQT